LPHTDFCFSAPQVKQLVGLNRSNDVSTLRAGILIHQLSDDVKPAYVFIAAPARYALILNSLGIQTYFESKSLARFCCDFLNLQRLAESAFCHFVTAIEA
jgi:hypothetical protein